MNYDIQKSRFLHFALSQPHSPTAHKYCIPFVFARSEPNLSSVDTTRESGSGRSAAELSLLPRSES